MGVSWPPETIPGMNDAHDPRRAALTRDRASSRVRRLTTGFVAGATLLTAAFDGLAASSTHTAKRVVKTVTRTHAATTTTTPAKTVTAPTPALVPNGSTATPPSQSQSQSQSQTVTPAAAPPVVVSGGS
jgi:hypothetical protein